MALKSNPIFPGRQLKIIFRLHGERSIIKYGMKNWLTSGINFQGTVERIPAIPASLDT